MKKKKVIQFISNSSGFYSLCDDRTWKRVASSKTSTPPSTRKKEKWIQTSENGTTITFDKAVAILWGANNYLAQHKGENCTCGGCFVCAMNFFSHAHNEGRKEALEEAKAIFQKYKETPMTGNVVLLELEGLGRKGGV